MRLVFSLCKVFSFCFFINAFSSCKIPSVVTGGPDRPRNHGTISIIRSNTTSGKLEMIDQKGESAQIYNAWYGQTIKWKIKDTAVRSFDSMPPKKQQLYSIFKREPHKKLLSRTWKAKIEKTTDKGVQKYFYNIIWTDNAGKSHTHDPLIQVKPK